MSTNTDGDGPKFVLVLRMRGRWTYTEDGDFRWDGKGVRDSSGPHVGDVRGGLVRRNPDL